MSADVPSDDLLAEQAYLVARGVRTLSLVGHCDADQMTMLRVATRIEQATCQGAVPFVIDHGNEVASYGYAAAAWVVDLYEWANDPTQVAQEQRHRINGLLLGYSAAAVARHDEENSGRRFKEVL
jgi:thiamine monophosphate synthase